MFWSGLLWTFLFGSWSTTLIPSSVAAFEYNGYEFGNTTFRLTNLPDFESANSILFDTYDIALSHGWGLNWYYIKPKRLLIEWVLTAASSSELETVIDAMKYALLQNEQTLTYTKPNNVVVQGTASCTRLAVNRKPYHITFVPVSIELTVLDGFLYDTEVNEVTDSGNTSNFSWTISVTGWNYEVRPIFVFTYNSATSCTSLSLTCNWETITVSDTFSNGDIIIIDSKNKDVTINSVSWQDYTWEFPSLPLGDTSYSVTSDGTFNISLVVQRYNTYV